MLTERLLTPFSLFLLKFEDFHDPSMKVNKTIAKVLDILPEETQNPVVLAGKAEQVTFSRSPIC